MTYKELVKSQWEVIIRYRITREILLYKQERKEITKKYSMHRNSVGNILKLFNQKISQENKDILLSGRQLPHEEIELKFVGLGSLSCRPNKLRWIAPPTLEKQVKKIFEKHNRWYKRVRIHIFRRYGKLHTKAIIKGIYKRNKLRVRKVKTRNWERIALYDYDSLVPFEYMHYDVKHILDQWALPKDIYDKYLLTKDLPIYQRTIIDACTRIRYLAYSHVINATMWFEFLKIVLMFIRALCVDYKITVGFDWWVEFCSASTVKLASRQEKLSPLNVVVYQYDWPKDIRKNLIERSHKTDDEEFYVPRSHKIYDRDSFVKEAHDRSLYYNKYREHSWICMNWFTPYEKLCSYSLILPQRFLNFPTLILDECLWDIMYHTKTIDLAIAIKENPIFHDQKSLVDFKNRLCIVNNSYAQKVLDLYPSSVFLLLKKKQIPVCYVLTFFYFI